MGLKVGDVAMRAGVNLQTIRYYEREGLLPSPPRLASGYRAFPEGAVLRVRFIKRAQELGFSLGEIRDLLSLPGKSGAQQVRARTKAKIADIEEKIETLQRMKRSLSELITACSRRRKTNHCPILNCLEASGDPT